MIVHEDREERDYEIPATARLRVQDGQMINAGDLLTEGSKNPHEILAILGAEAARDYLVVEIQKVYRSQGVTISDKHIEVIIRQMLRRVMISESGNSEILPGELFDRLDLEELNERLIAEGGEPAEATPVVLGITKAALNTESFLAAASFQHTISVLAGAAIEGKVDELRALKESVLLGKLIPAGTGFKAAAMRREAFEALTAPKPEGEEALDLTLSDADLLGEFSGALLSSDTDSLLGDLEAEFGVTTTEDVSGGEDSDGDDVDGIVAIEGDADPALDEAADGEALLEATDVDTKGSDEE